MTVPRDDELTRRMREHLKGGTGRTPREIASALANRLQVSQEDRAARFPSGGQTFLRQIDVDSLEEN